MVAFIFGFLVGAVVVGVVKAYFSSAKGQEEVAVVKADANVAAEAVTTVAEDAKKAV
jgi:hypothetical protein